MPFACRPAVGLDELSAYDAMCVFLEAYWISLGKSSDDLAVLLSGLNRELRIDGSPLDPAMWSDWQAAVDQALAMGGDPRLRPDLEKPPH